MIKFQNYGQLRDVNATDGELAIFELLQSLVPNIELVRRSDSYVTALLGEWDLARFKFTDRAKWIAFPTAEAGQVKHRIASPEDVRAFPELINESLAIIKKYS